MGVVIDLAAVRGVRRANLDHRHLYGQITAAMADALEELTDAEIVAFFERRTKAKMKLARVMSADMRSELNRDPSYDTKEPPEAI